MADSTNVFEEGSNLRLVETIERLTGKDLTLAERKLIARGADEEDLVNSGLEDSMINAYHNIMETLRGDKRMQHDMRTAAFVHSLSRIGQSYELLGIFP